MAGSEDGEMTAMEMVGRLHASMVDKMQDFMVQVERRSEAKDREIAALRESVEQLLVRVTQLEQQGLESPSGRGKRATSKRPSAAASPDHATITETSAARSSRPVSRAISRKTSGTVFQLLPDNLDGAMRFSIRGKTISVWPPPDHTPQPQLDARAPAVDASIAFVHGYQGKRGRSNLFDLAGGETVFTSARLAVLYDAEHNSQRVYTEHTEEIKCIGLHPDGELIATGQASGVDADSKAHVRVWDIATLATKQVVGAGILGKGVACLAFSHAEPDLMVTVDESINHVVTLWNWGSNQRLTEAKGHNDSVFAAEFNPMLGTVAIIGKGHVSFWSVSAEDRAKCSLSRRPGLFQNHDKPKAILSVAFSPVTGDCLTGTSSGDILVWGPPMPSFVITRVIKGAHAGGVYALAATEHGFLSGGGKDNTVKIWDWNYELYPVQEGETNAVVLEAGVRTIAPAQTPDGLSLSQYMVGTLDNDIVVVDASDGSVDIVIHGTIGAITSASQHPFKEWFTYCSEDASVRTFDQDHILVWEWVTAGEDVASVAYHPTSGLLAAGLSSGEVVILDEEGQEQDRFPVGAGVSVLSYSPDGRKLAVCVHDLVLAIYDCSTPTYKRLGQSRGHRDTIRSVDWTSSGRFLRTTSVDHDVMFWDAGRQTSVVAASVKHAKWHTSTTNLGWGVLGAWASDGTELTGVDRNVSGDVVAVGDDSGRLRFLRYPAYAPKAASIQPPQAHASALTCVKFIGPNRVMTAGKTDCLVEWRLA